MNALSLLVDGFLDDFINRLQSADKTPETGTEVDALRSIWPEPGARTASILPERLAACDNLEPALDLASSGVESKLATRIAALAPALRWTYSYPAKSGDRTLASRIAFSQIVGAKGLRPDDRIHIGLTLIAPHVAYPAHAHPAVELYMVVAGTAAWQSGGGQPVQKPAGSIIVHPSGVPHAMTTSEQPLLAIWTWRGDLLSPSVYLDSDAA